MNRLTKSCLIDSHHRNGRLHAVTDIMKSYRVRIENQEDEGNSKIEGQICHKIGRLLLVRIKQQRYPGNQDDQSERANNRADGILMEQANTGGG